MLRRSHSIRERLEGRLLNGEELLARGGNLREVNVSPDFPTGKTGNDYFDLSLEVSGCRKQDLEAMIIDDMLIVKGSKSVDKVWDETSFINSEHEVASFERVFELNKTADRDTITARLEGEVLQIRIYHVQPDSKPGKIAHQIEITE